MDRYWLRYGYVPALSALVAASLVAGGGCRSVLTTAAYLIKGTNVDADYDGLKEKKIVVVCQPLTALTYRDSEIAGDLGREISILLKENVSKIQVINHQKVAEWIDENGDWEEYTEVGEALGAEMVVAIDLQEFTIFKSQTLYQGKASVHLQVFDCATGEETVFEKELAELVYPVNAAIPTDEKPESAFRREYIRILADQIARHFYPHDKHADYAIDTRLLD